jgi:pimeloyl-ACP methyl ester carboxylesterase
VSEFTPISYTSADGLVLHARAYPPAGETVPVEPAHDPVNPAPGPGLHGLTRNAADFEELAPRIASLGRRVLAPDMRGRGHSAHDPDPAHYSMQVYAGDVATLMAGLGIAQAIFIGTSMGGLITMTLAEQHPELVAAAVLNDIGPIVSDRGLARIAGYAGKPVAFACWEQAAGYLRDLNQAIFPTYPDTEWDKWARRAFAPDAAGRLLPRYDPNIALALRDGKASVTSPALRRAFRRLAQTHPTLLIRGALSDLLEEGHAAWMRRAAPSMRYVVVPDVGHAPMLTEPAAFAAISGFLAGLP